jgi:dephospho-CoA kinase
VNPKAGPVTVAVTGSISSGKSTFVEMLGELGAETASSDEMVHELLSDDAETIRRVIERFGNDVLGEEGVDRRALGAKVFADPEALKDLEDILHPLVREETDRRVAASKAEMFVAEVPLLFEGTRSGVFDYTVAVLPPEEKRKEWAAERGVGEERLKAIEARQLSGEEKASRADIVIQNDGGLELLRQRAVELRDEILPGRHSDGHEDKEEVE